MIERIETIGRSATALACVLLALLLAVSAIAEEEPQYVENEWNYVDGSMDVSGGIPEGATGRLARIRSAGKLTVATAPSYPPQEFTDDTLSGQNRFVGADMELARLIAGRMGVDLEIVPLEFADVLTAVSEGRVDLGVSAISFTSARASVMEMSKGYYYTPELTSSGLIIREADAEAIRGVEDLAELDIVAQRGSLQETMAAESIALYRKFRRLPAAADVYDAVIAGEADAGIVDIGIARVYLESHPDCGLAIVPDVLFTLPTQYQGDRIVAKKGELELMYFVNGVIDEVLSSGQYESWFDDYSHYTAGRG